MNFQVTSFLHKVNLVYSTCSLSDCRLSAIVYWSFYVFLFFFVEAEKSSFQVNEWPGWFLRSLAGSESFWVSPCSFHLISTLHLVSPIQMRNQECFRERGVFSELGHFDKQSSKTRKEKSPQGKISGFFSWKLLKIVL